MASSQLSVLLLYYVWPVVTVLTASAIGLWMYANHWTERGVKWFVVTLAAGGGMNVCVFVMAVVDDPTVDWLSLFPRVGLFSWFALSFVVFCSVYTDTYFHRRPLFGVAILVSLAGQTLLAATSPLHDQMFVWYEHRTAAFSYIAAEPADTYVVLIILTVLLVGYGSYVMVRHLLSTRRHAGGQIVLLLLGVISVALFELAGTMGLVPVDGFSHTSYGVLPLLLFVFLAFFRFSFLDIKPVARSTVVENLRDPVLVLDDQQNVVDFNEASTHLWPEIDGYLQYPFETACPALASEIEVPPTTDRTTTQIALPFDGRDRHFSATVSEVSARDEGADLYSVVLRDVTDLERSRRQLEIQNERLDQVAGTISHDLRNPINVATGYTDMLETHRDDTPSETGVDAQQCIEKIRDSHERMLEIIDDVLTIAREGKSVEETEDVDLTTVATEAWEYVDTGNASLTVRGDATVRAHRSKLLTIFENLFRNALDHGPADVSVVVETTTGGFSVADDGPGIPANYLEDVFEYGYTTDDAGTGLGLSIVRTMAESHGWSVAVDDDYDDGARFVFSNVEVTDSNELGQSAN